MDALNKQGLIQFVDLITTKGWINPNTGGGWKAAVNKILADMDGSEDVRTIDVALAIRRYNNLHPGELSPGSLLQYEKRIKTAIEQYQSYVADPTKYKAPARPITTTPTTKSNGKNRKAAGGDDALTEPTVTEILPLPPAPAPKPHALQLPQISDNSLTLPFPLRADFLAHIAIPRDMTKSEAQRLCAFIQTLATQE